MAKNLKIVGAGDLGLRVALMWREKFPDAKIYLKNRTENTERAARWKAAGFIPLSVEKDDNLKTPFVVFSASPTGNPNYCQVRVCTVLSFSTILFSRRHALLHCETQKCFPNIDKHLLQSQKVQSRLIP